MLARLTNHSLLNYVSANLALLVAIGIGAGTYFVMILFMRIKEVDNMMDAVKRGLGRTEGQKIIAE